MSLQSEDVGTQSFTQVVTAGPDNPDRSFLEVLGRNVIKDVPLINDTGSVSVRRKTDGDEREGRG